ALVSGVSPAVPTHWTVMVVVGSRCQVRNSVSGRNGGSSPADFKTAAAGSSAPGSRPAASPASAVPRNARREGESIPSAPQWLGDESFSFCGAGAGPTKDLLEKAPPGGGGSAAWPAAGGR